MVNWVKRGSKPCVVVIDQEELGDDEREQKFKDLSGGAVKILCPGGRNP